MFVNRNKYEEIILESLKGLNSLYSENNNLRWQNEMLSDRKKEIKTELIQNNKKYKQKLDNIRQKTKDEMEKQKQIYKSKLDKIKNKNQNEINKLNKQINELNKDITSRTEEINNLHGEMLAERDRLVHDNIKLTYELGDLKQQIRELREVIHNKKEKLKDMKDGWSVESQNMLNDINDIQVMLNQNMLDENKQKLDDLRKKMTEETLIHNTNIGQIAADIERYNKLLDELIRLQDSEKKLTEKIVELDGLNASKLTEIHKLTGIIEAEQQKYDKEKKEIINEFENILSEIKTRYNGQVEQLHGELDNKDAQIESLELENSGMKSDQQKLISRTNELESINSELNVHLSEYSNKNKKLLDTNKSVEQYNIKLEGINKELYTQNTEQHARFDEINKKMEQLIVENDNKLTELQTDNKRLHADNNILNVDLTMLRKDNERLSGNNTKLVDDLADCNQKVVALNNVVSKMDNHPPPVVEQPVVEPVIPPSEASPSHVSLSLSSMQPSVASQVGPVVKPVVESVIPPSEASPSMPPSVASQVGRITDNIMYKAVKSTYKKPVIMELNDIGDKVLHDNFKLFKVKPLIIDRGNEAKVDIKEIPKVLQEMKTTSHINPDQHAALNKMEDYGLKEQLIEADKELEEQTKDQRVLKSFMRGNNETVLVNTTDEVVKLDKPFRIETIMLNDKSNNNQPLEVPLSLPSTSNPSSSVLLSLQSTRNQPSINESNPVTMSLDSFGSFSIINVDDSNNTLGTNQLLSVNMPLMQQEFVTVAKCGDPSYIETIYLFLVHGTFATPEEFGRDKSTKITYDMFRFAYQLSIAHKKKVEVISFKWSGKLSDAHRKAYGKVLANKCNVLYYNNNNSEFWFIAHSHGCNVVLFASIEFNNNNSKQFHTAILLACPPDVPTSAVLSVDNIYHFYTDGDFTQGVGTIQRNITNNEMFNSIRTITNKPKVGCKIYNIRTQFDGYNLNHISIKWAVMSVIGLLLGIIDTKYDCHYDLDTNIFSTYKDPLVAIRTRDHRCDDPGKQIFETQSSLLDEDLFRIAYNRNIRDIGNMYIYGITWFLNLCDEGCQKVTNKYETLGYYQNKLYSFMGMAKKLQRETISEPERVYKEIKQPQIPTKSSSGGSRNGRSSRNGRLRVYRLRR